jgi:hypothetical protein
VVWPPDEGEGKAAQPLVFQLLNGNGEQP